LPLGHNLGRVPCAAKLEFRSFMLRDGGKPQARYKHANNGELGALGNRRPEGSGEIAEFTPRRISSSAFLSSDLCFLALRENLIRSVCLACAYSRHVFPIM
jgi:hypothetical protein